MNTNANGGRDLHESLMKKPFNHVLAEMERLLYSGNDLTFTTTFFENLSYWTYVAITSVPTSQDVQLVTRFLLILCPTSESRKVVIHDDLQRHREVVVKFALDCLALRGTTILFKSTALKLFDQVARPLTVAEMSTEAFYRVELNEAMKAVCDWFKNGGERHALTMLLFRLDQVSADYEHSELHPEVMQALLIDELRAWSTVSKSWDSEIVEEFGIEGRVCGLIYRAMSNCLMCSEVRILEMKMFFELYPDEPCFSHAKQTLLLRRGRTLQPTVQDQDSLYKWYSDALDKARPMAYPSLYDIYPVFLAHVKKAEEQYAKA